MLERYVPLRTKGDGNCCFRAAALAVFGSETFHDYARLITAMEVINHRNGYDTSSANYCGTFRDDRIITPPYQQLVNEVTKTGQPVHLIILHGMGLFLLPRFIKIHKSIFSQYYELTLQFFLPAL